MNNITTLTLLSFLEPRNRHDVFYQEIIWKDYTPISAILPIHLKIGLKYKMYKILHYSGGG